MDSCAQIWGGRKAYSLIYLITSIHYSLHCVGLKNIDRHSHLLIEWIDPERGKYKLVGLTNKLVRLV